MSRACLPWASRRQWRWAGISDGHFLQSLQPDLDPRPGTCPGDTFLPAVCKPEQSPTLWIPGIPQAHHSKSLYRSKVPQWGQLLWGWRSPESIRLLTVDQSWTSRTPWKQPCQHIVSRPTNTFECWDGKGVLGNVVLNLFCANQQQNSGHCGLRS